VTISHLIQFLTSQLEIPAGNSTQSATTARGGWTQPSLIQSDGPSDDDPRWLHMTELDPELGQDKGRLECDVCVREASEARGR